MTARCRTNVPFICIFFIYFCAVLLLKRHLDNTPLRRKLQTREYKSMRYAPNLASTLEREVRLFCCVLTTPKNHKTKALAVRQTWGKRCTKLLFVTAEKDSAFETLQLPIEEEYRSLWGKTRGAFQYIYDHYKDEADWFIKADDDTFVFVENLRYLLYPYSPEMPIYFGHNLFLNYELDSSYMSGGAGYVLSREALNRLVTNAFADPSKCAPMESKYAEDVEMGICLNDADVLAADSRDETLKIRFVLFKPYYFLLPIVLQRSNWYMNYSFYNVQSCQDCLSEYAVSFHYIDPRRMRQFQYFKYEFKLFGLEEDDDTVATTLPKKLKPEEVIIRPSDNYGAIFS